MKLKQILRGLAPAAALTFCGLPLPAFAQLQTPLRYTLVADTQYSVDPISGTRLPFFWEDTSIRGNSVVWVSPGAGEAYIEGEYGGVFRATLGTECGPFNLPCVNAIVTTDRDRNPTNNRRFTFYGDHLTGGTDASGNGGFEVFQANDDQLASGVGDPNIGLGQTTGFYLRQITGQGPLRVVADSNTRFPNGRFYSLNNFNGAFGYDGTNVAFAAIQAGSPNLDRLRDGIFSRNVSTPTAFGPLRTVVTVDTTNPSNPSRTFQGFEDSVRVSGQNLVFRGFGRANMPANYLPTAGTRIQGLYVGNANGGDNVRGGPVTVLVDTFTTCPYQFSPQYIADNGPVRRTVFQDFGANGSFSGGRRTGYASVRGNNVVFAGSCADQDDTRGTFPGAGRAIFTGRITGSTQTQRSSVRVLIDDKYRLPGGRFFNSFGDVTFNENGNFIAFEAISQPEADRGSFANERVGLYVFNVNTRRLTRVIEEGDYLDGLQVVQQSRDPSAYYAANLPAIAFQDQSLSGGTTAIPLLRVAFRLTFGTAPDVPNSTFRQRLYVFYVPTN